MLDAGGGRGTDPGIFDILGLWLDSETVVAGGDDDDGRSDGSDEFGVHEGWMSEEWFTPCSELIPIGIEVGRDVGGWNGGCTGAGRGAKV